MRVYHQTSWRDAGWGGRPFSWRERLALAVLALAALPILLLLLAVVTIIAIGASVVGLAAWAIGKLLLVRRPRPAAVIETEYTRIEEPHESARPGGSDPWGRR